MSRRFPDLRFFFALNLEFYSFIRTLASPKVLPFGNKINRDLFCISLTYSYLCPHETS